jgi:hypothetical protein
MGMGFNMKKLFLVGLSLSFLLMTTSCLKKQDLSDDNLGPAIDSLELTKALGSAVGTYDYNDIKKNEFTSLLISQRIQDSVVTNIEQQGITVQNAVNTVDSLSLDLLIQKETYSGGQTTQSTVQWPAVFQKGSASAQSIQAKAPAPANLMFFTFEQLAFGICHNTATSPDSCHNLVVQDVQFRVPFAAAAQHNCADAGNCTISAKNIQFDRIEHDNLDKDGTQRRTHFTVIISSQVPFLSKMLQFCTRGLYEISSANQKILADMCYTVNNYAFGH